MNLQFFIPMLLCILYVVFLLTCTNLKAYAIHVAIGISAFIPVWNIFVFVAVIAYTFLRWDKVKLKSNKLTKFLFNKQNQKV